MKSLHAASALCALWLAAGVAQSQRAPSPPAAAAPTPVPPPATKLEAFKPSAGSVVTLGFNELGDLRGVSVDVRELRDTKGAVARGLLVEVKESEYREERSFVDADEIPELLRGIDALLDIKANPTKFENFEARYETHGELEITAYNYNGHISYAVTAGRTIRARRLGLSASEIGEIRAMVANTAATLNALLAK